MTKSQAQAAAPKKLSTRERLWELVQRHSGFLCLEELARRLGKTPQRVGQIVKEWEGAGMVDISYDKWSNAHIVSVKQPVS